MRPISERELNMRLEDEEVIALIQGDAADLGSHFTGYAVEIEDCQPYSASDNSPGQKYSYGICPGHYLLNVIAQSDVPINEESWNSSDIRRTINVEQREYSDIGFKNLYERAQSLIALLEGKGIAKKVAFYFPVNLLDIEEVLALIQKDSADLDPHFVGYEVEVDNCVSCYDSIGSVRRSSCSAPEPYLLKVIAQSDIIVNEETETSSGIRRIVIAEKGGFSHADFQNLYKRAQSLVALLEGTGTDKKVLLRCPETLP